MIILVLVLLGLSLGSFVNALVWRVHEQDGLKAKSLKQKAKRMKELSIARGRSMCVHCGHTLAARDLIPLLSWLSLRGRCRYCQRPISWQYPSVELLTAGLFICSYVFWPEPIVGFQLLAFSFWLLFLTGFMALIVSDLRWYLLPNKMVFPLMALAGVQAILQLAYEPSIALVTAIIGGIAVGGGLFYVLFQVSNGKWIGGGDVKLGFLLGAVLGSPSLGVLYIFIASLLGTFVSVPLLVSGRAKQSTRIPFGPFLIISAIIVRLFGQTLINWYTTQLGI